MVSKINNMVCWNAFKIQHLEEYEAPNVYLSKSLPYKERYLYDTSRNY